jgi:hypothetical protein
MSDAPEDFPDRKAMSKRIAEQRKALHRLEMYNRVYQKLMMQYNEKNKTLRTALDALPKGESHE